MSDSGTEKLVFFPVHVNNSACEIIAYNTAPIAWRRIIDVPILENTDWVMDSFFEFKKCQSCKNTKQNDHLESLVVYEASVVFIAQN